jgi:hypothetical protein
MADKTDNIKVLDCKATDHEYLHKDFHGALCYAIAYLDKTYGPEATTEYLQQVGRSFYAPLSTKLKKQGLSVLEQHYRDIFTKEGGKFSLSYDNGTLVLTVDECPAIAHLKKRNHFFTERFCETTVVVNQTICTQAGYRCSCKYQPGAGRCVQKFWKAKR